MRGERFRGRLAPPVFNGSSPHARGTPWLDARFVTQVRFIPACAGNAFHSSTFCRISSVHPRMRGERTLSLPVTTASGGSSPHARGTQTRRTLPMPATRFIPACAGNASIDRQRTALHTVHPRMRGERRISGCSRCRTVGSSPHARGTRNRPRQQPAGLRFIPACAGNACCAVLSNRVTAVHPRMRGERFFSRGKISGMFGSSPHARGTLFIDNHGDVFNRFIPACAGNACSGRFPRFLPAVHPRMRGERRWKVYLRTTADGSSPHARGTLNFRCPCATRCRFIPACAGNALATFG